MRVRGILSTKGSNVVMVTPETLVSDVVRTLAEKRIGAVVVDDRDGGVAGIMTERDVVRALASHGCEALEKPVSAFMTREVVTAGLDDTTEEIMGRMTRGKFRHVPIMDGDHLAGMISIGDVVKYRMDQIEAEASAMRDYIATA